MSDHETITAIREFWFGPLVDGWSDDAHRARWFAPNAEFDRAIATRFGTIMQQQRNGELEHWRQTPAGLSAYILVADQFSRNVHRGAAAAYAFDVWAKAAAYQGVNEGLDVALSLEERGFFYLPFEHAESVVDQTLSVALFTALRDQTPKGFRHLTGNSLRYAQQHYDIIARFGRFPHRNAVLGRVSTTAELQFVAAGDGFGQSPPED